MATTQDKVHQFMESPLVAWVSRARERERERERKIVCRGVRVESVCVCEREKGESVCEREERDRLTERKRQKHGERERVYNYTKFYAVTLVVLKPCFGQPEKTTSLATCAVSCLLPSTSTSYIY